MIAQEFLNVNHDVECVYKIGDKYFTKIDDALANRTVENFEIVKITRQEPEPEPAAEPDLKTKK